MMIYIALAYGLCVAGNWVSEKAGIPAPGFVLGTVVLFLMLQFRIIKVEKVKKTSDAVLGRMGILFVPVLVSLFMRTDEMRAALTTTIPTALITTILIFLISVAISRIFFKEKRND